MSQAELERLKKIEAVVKHLLDEEQWFHTAIELNPFGKNYVDGETLEKQLRELIDEN